jgi:hypothetical protein
LTFDLQSAIDDLINGCASAGSGDCNPIDHVSLADFGEEPSTEC